MKLSLSSKWFILYLLLLKSLFSMSQCPTVNNTSQSFCDIESLLISDLQANDEGAGIAWFSTPESTTPLSENISLINGGVYYLDNAAGDCGNRIAVTVSILGPPTGLNFQGVCVEDPNEATIDDLEAFGNDINWYVSSSSNTVLDLNTILTDGNIYYADQSNPETGCRTSRLAVQVNIGIVPVPTGDSIQEFCVGEDLIPTVADLVASGENLWYSSISSASPLDPSTPLQNGRSYFATIIDPPCESINRFEVQVFIIEQISAGTDGVLDICLDSNETFDLFQSLGGSPESGGTWLPALSSGTSIFDPNLDVAGVYTYTVLNTNDQCPDATASVTVSFETPPSAGTDGSLSICADDTATFNLFDSLGGTPDTNGTWSPALSSGTGVFDPSIDPEGTYTYTVVSQSSACADATASVTVSFETPPSAGSDGSLSICADDTSTFNLFESLGGTPDTNGTWSPALNSGSGVFDPSIDPEGAYTYTVVGQSSACADATASVTVSFEVPPSAGSNGSLSICADDTSTFNLFDSLGGTPDTSGTWSPALSSGTGIFDPSVDSEGAYTYTVVGQSSACADATASVTVSFEVPPSAGSDGSLSICADDTSTFNLFDSLGGTPDTSGTWSPALSSGTGIFDPSVDSEGTYSYTVVSQNNACIDATASVTVSFETPPSAGIDGSLSICANDTSTFDLFDSLGGTPDTSGTWSPALSSGTGIFDPSVDSEGTYTYTVVSQNSACANAAASVTISFETPPSAGTDGSLSICADDTSTFDLFDSLGGTPDTSGTWSPALSSGTGIFDPSVDSEGTYTYTVVSQNSACANAVASVTVSFEVPPSAGTDGSLSICADDTSTFNLFDSLGGTPNTNGTWSPALSSGTGVFDPSADSEGTYTYTVLSQSSACADATASVTVSFETPPSAGTDGSLSICADDTSTFNLFDSLGGTPNTNGTWSPALSSGTGVFDPSADSEGTYTYTVLSQSSACADATASVTVNFELPPSAGTNGSLSICADDTSTFDLFNSLGGTPDTNGTWSPALSSGTGVFDPSVDPEGTYTYTMPESQCGPQDVAQVTVSILPNPDISDLVILIDDVCEGEDVPISLSGLSNLENGDYSISFEVIGSNNFNRSLTVAVINGEITFLLESELFQLAGLHTFNILSIISETTGCTSSFDVELSELFELYESETPQINEEGGTFCVDEIPTLENLTNRLINNNGIEWYDSETSTNPLPINTVLVNGVTYYASLKNENGCTSFIRLAVTIILDDCIEELIIPDGFSPNGDSVNDTFRIVNLEELYPNFKLTIYNRYGNKLFEGNINTPRWDGTTTSSNIGNGIVPNGVYFYILEFNDGIRDAKQGRIYLNR